MTGRILSRLWGLPWTIQPEALETILDIAAGKPVEETSRDAWKSHMAARPAALEGRPMAPLAGSERARTRDGVAVVRVSGPIFRYANLMTDHSGATSLASVSADLQLAADDTRIRAILLEIDSPGGEVTGMAEAAGMIRAIAERKPVVAYTEGLAASAAYQIAASAQEIVVAPTAMLGSLGVVVGMTDRRDADAKSGLRRYEIVSSQTPGKRPDVATEGGRAQFQALADRLADEFLADVAASRGMAVADLLAATNGGGMLIGVDAVAAGIADRIGTFEETLSRLASGGAPVGRRRRPVAALPPATAISATTQDITTMTQANDQPAATAEQAATPAPAVPSVAATEQPPVALDAVQQERARAAGIQAAARPEFHALATLALQEGWSVDAFTRAQDASAQAVTAATTAVRAQAFQASMPAAVPHGDIDPSTMTAEQRADADWAQKPELRAEFGDKAAFLAFRRAEAAGKVRVLATRRQAG